MKFEIGIVALLVSGTHAAIWSRPNAWEQINSCSEFSQFCSIVSTYQNFVDQLKLQELSATVFVPTNQAMDDAREYLDGLDSNDLEKVISYHFVVGMGTRGIPELHTGKLMTTEYCPNSLLSHPQMLEVFKDRKTHQVWVGNDLNVARIVKGNIQCSNAMIHGISHVLIPPENVVETARRFPTTFPHSMSMWLKALEITGLDGKLASATAVTVLPPTNQAFKRLGQSTLNYLFSAQGRDTLRAIIEYHIIMETDYDQNIPQGERQIPTALQGKSILVDKCDMGTVINKKATVIYADVLCSNGVMHLLDCVLMPFSIPK